MVKVMGVILTMNELDELELLTNHRCTATVPFAARYRLIDFVMSSMVNSGMTNVAVLLKKKYRSLMDHLGSGKEWDLDRKRSGLFMLPPCDNEQPQGELYSLYKHKDYLLRSEEEYVLISGGNIVCNMDFKPVFDEHHQTKADVTVLYKETDAIALGSRTLTMNSKGRVLAVYSHSLRMSSHKVCMEMYLLRKELLLELMEDAMAHGQSLTVSKLIMKHLDRLVVHGHRYRGYLGIIDTLERYYHHSMNMLNPLVWKELFVQGDGGLIYTKIKDEPPAYYSPGSKVSNSLVANGCVIEGSVENSILFRGVHVHPGAHVRNSIVMQAGQIFDGSVIEHAILDKDVIIHANRTLSGHPAVPFVAGKRKVI